MHKVWKVIILLLFPLSLIAGGILIYNRMTTNEIEKRLEGTEPFAVQLSFVDESRDPQSLEGMAQLVIYPAERFFLFYFVNTDAYLGDSETPLRNSPPGDGDLFSDFTGVQNSYSVAIHRKSGERILNILGGLSLFLEQPLLLEESHFQYPQGHWNFSGEQVMEYLYSRRVEKDPTRVYLNGVDRVYRMESILLTLFYRMEELYEKVDHPELWKVITALPDTNLGAEEIRSLVRYASSKKDPVHAIVMEIPLEEIPLDRRGYSKKLAIKEKRARQIYREFLENMKAGRLSSDAFLLEVLNGTDNNGLARRVKQFIQNRDLLVLDVDNYPYKPLKKSVILERSGSSFRASRLRDLTGLKESQVFFQRRPSDVDSTLILGDDFRLKKLNVY